MYLSQQALLAHHQPSTSPVAIAIDGVTPKVAAVLKTSTKTVNKKNAQHQKDRNARAKKPNPLPVTPQPITSRPAIRDTDVSSTAQCQSHPKKRNKKKVPVKLTAWQSFLHNQLLMKTHNMVMQDLTTTNPMHKSNNTFVSENNDITSTF